jgi:hypothetical protein
MHTDELTFTLPPLPTRWHWHLLADTASPSPGDIHEPGREPLLGDNPVLPLVAKSAVLCIGREVTADYARRHGE